MLRTTNSKLRTMDPKGFTLIEIIILIVLAGILLPAIIVPFASGVKGSGKPEIVNKAMFLAQQRMEEFMKFDYSNAALNAIALTPYSNTDFPNYQWQWSIAYVNSNLAASGMDVGYKLIFVRVQDPENSTYDLTSVVTNFP